MTHLMDKTMSNTREELASMDIGTTREVVFSNGILRSTRELCKNSDNEFEVHSFIEGWCTATLTLDEAVDYCEGRLNGWELEWE